MPQNSLPFISIRKRTYFFPTCPIGAESEIEEKNGKHKKSAPSLRVFGAFSAPFLVQICNKNLELKMQLCIEVNTYWVKKRHVKNRMKKHAKRHAEKNKSGFLADFLQQV